MNHQVHFQKLDLKNLTKLSNHDLDLHLKSLVSHEREILSEILLHIREVDRRRLYLQLSFGSLFDYLTKHLGYSAGSAQRRIDAARLSEDVPSVIEDLESGSISLAQVSLLQKSVRLAKKEFQHTKLQPQQSIELGAQGQHSVSAEAKAQLLEAIKSKSIPESQVILSSNLHIKIKSQAITTHQADGSVRLEVTLSKVQWEKLERMKALISHSVPSGSWDEALEYVADRVIKAKTNTREKKTFPRCEAESKTIDATSSIPAITKSHSIALTAEKTRRQSPSFYQLKKSLLAKNSCCQYHDAQTKKSCTSTWQLQIDHIKPKWAGGADDHSNLRVLCGMHNREVYRKQGGIVRH